MSAHIVQAPGWWSNLVRVVCPKCDYAGPTRDLNERPSMYVAVKIERDRHLCHDEQDAGR